MTHQRIPTWLLERVLLDEVPPELDAEVRQILDQNPAERARLAELERSNAEILAELPPARVAAEVARRASATGGFALLLNVVRPGGPARPSMRRRAFALSSSLAVAAGLVLIAVAVVRQPGRSGEPVAGAGDTGDGVDTGDQTRAKGHARLLLHRKVDGEAPILRAGAVVSAGDRIQVKYQANGRRHGVILSIDGRGTVTLHFPADERASTALGQGDAVALDHSYELDDAPAFERFVFVTADQPIRVADVLAGARSLAADPTRRAGDELRLAAGQQQTWYTLRKKEVAP